METSAPAVLSRMAECAALLAIGHQLRAAQLFSATDAEAAQRLAGYLTLPAVVLQSCNTWASRKRRGQFSSLPPVSWPALLGGSVVLLSSAAAAAFAWTFFKNRHKRERAVLAGCCVGNDAPAVAVPLIEALAGPAGVVAACSALVANSLTVYLGSYLLTASAGPAFPEAYQHEDGGTYRGEWRGMSKEGLGTYTYASGARYEGEWRDNVKAGRGVYYFPKGGTYEGEWAGGVMSGTGLRTYSSGRVSAGRWEGGQLVAPLELWQCANAAEGAAEAALAARRVVVGGGQPQDAAQLLVLQPVLWAALIGLALNTLALPLPRSLEAVTAALAPANKPLMLLSAGMMMQPVLPQSRQVRDVTAVTAARVACALLFSSVALAMLPYLAPTATAAAAAATSSISTQQLGLLSVLSASLILLSPLPPAILEFTRSFRLNEVLSGACRDVSVLAAGPLLLLLVAAVGVLGLLPAGLPAMHGPLQQQLLGQDWLAASGAAADATRAVTVLASAMLLLAAAVAAGAGVVWDKLAPRKGKLLKYAGGAAAAAAAASTSTGDSSSSPAPTAADLLDGSSTTGSEPSSGATPGDSASSGSSGSGSSKPPSAVSPHHKGCTVLTPPSQQPLLAGFSSLRHCRVLQPGYGVQRGMTSSSRCRSSRSSNVLALAQQHSSCDQSSGGVGEAAAGQRRQPLGVSQHGNPHRLVRLGQRVVGSRLQLLQQQRQQQRLGVLVAGRRAAFVI